MSYDAPFSYPYTHSTTARARRHAAHLEEQLAAAEADAANLAAALRLLVDETDSYVLSSNVAVARSAALEAIHDHDQAGR